MYDHLGIKVRDLAASIRFYEAALAPLGHVLGSHDDSYAGIGPAGAPALWLYAAKDAQAAADAAQACCKANTDKIDRMFEKAMRK